MSEINITVGDRSYRLAVTPGEEDLLKACAEKIDQKIKGINRIGKVLSADQLAVLAALEIVYDHAQAQGEQRLDDTQDKLTRAEEDVDRLIELCEDALTQTSM